MDIVIHSVPKSVDTRERKILYWVIVKQNMTLFPNPNRPVMAVFLFVSNVKSFAPATQGRKEF